MSKSAPDYGTSSDRLINLGRLTVGSIVLWSLLMAGSLAWNIQRTRLETRTLAKKEALATINKDLSFRYWATKHGGVYVPATQDTPPNPYLSSIPERDITLPSGKLFTLMNPAYILRQTMKQYEELYGTRGHLTSLKLLNPLNKPDEWERNALESFERGVKEVSEFTRIDGEPYLRMMRPTVTAKGCLKCHNTQGYKEGDIRGGLTVAVPMAAYIAIENEAVASLVLSHVIILFMGLAGIYFVYYRSRVSIKRLLEMDEKVRNQTEFLGTVIESLTHPFYVIDANNYAVIMANSAAKRIFSAGESTCYAMTHKRDKPCSDGEHLCPLKISKETKMSAVCEHIHFDNDGNPKNIEVHGYPIHDRDGNVVQMIEYALDITERKKAEEDLKRLNAELEERVKQRTSELEEKNMELGKMNKIFVGREIRMVELKETIRELEKKLAKERS